MFHLHFCSLFSLAIPGSIPVGIAYARKRSGVAGKSRKEGKICGETVVVVVLVSISTLLVTVSSSSNSSSTCSSGSIFMLWAS